MVVHAMYIFNRRGVCLFYKEWHRPRNTLAGNPDEDKKLMYLPPCKRVLLCFCSPTLDIESCGLLFRSLSQVWVAILIKATSTTNEPRSRHNRGDRADSVQDQVVLVAFVSPRFIRPVLQSIQLLTRPCPPLSDLSHRQGIALSQQAMVLPVT